MPQLTLDGVTERARTLADRTTSQATRVMPGVRPSRTARRAATSSGLAAMAASARGLAAGTQLLRSAPVSARLAWRAGKLLGRAQGAGALAPHVVRGQWAGLNGQMQAWAARTRVRTIAQWLPAALAGTRLLGQVWPVQRPAQQGAALTSRSRLTQLAYRAGRATGMARGSAASGKAAARAAQAATKAAATGTTATRGPWLLRRGAPQGPIQATGRRLRRGWRWTRLFTLGLAVGATWAYLFAPRRGPAYTALSQNAQGTQPV